MNGSSVIDLCMTTDQLTDCKSTFYTDNDAEVLTGYPVVGTSLYTPNLFCRARFQLKKLLRSNLTTLIGKNGGQLRRQTS